jgi:DNA polymerase-3 subunit epsilon
MNNGNFLVFDTETTGFVDFKAPPEAEWQPRLVQLGAILCEPSGAVQAEINLMVRPDGFIVPPAASDIHGITTERASKHGIPLHVALMIFHQLCKRASLLVAFNMVYDESVIVGECWRSSMPHPFRLGNKFCAMLACKDILKLPGKVRGDYKWPKLTEAHRHFFNSDFDGAHDAMAEVRATMKIYLELKKQIPAIDEKL